jgi:hypothetical protein
MHQPHSSNRSRPGRFSGRGVAMLRRGGAMLLVAFVAACGDSGPTEPAGNGKGSITARVDGTAWNGSAAALATRGTGFIAVGGTEGGQRNITIAFPADGPGTYSIPNAIGMNFNYNEFSTSRVWQAVAMGATLGGVGTGTLTVTALTAERVAGTFTFTAPAATSSNATGTRTVTNGAFDIRF